VKCDDCSKIIIREEDIGLEMEFRSGKKIVLCHMCTDKFLGSLVKKTLPYFIREFKKKGGKTRLLKGRKKLGRG